MIELNERQRQELATDPPRAVDPVTRKTYVLVSEEVYERLQSLLIPDRLTPDEQLSLLRAAGMRAGWNDPEMDIYDQEEPGSEQT